MSANLKRHWLQGVLIAVTAAIVVIGSIEPMGIKPIASAQTSGSGPAPSDDSQTSALAAAPGVGSQVQALRQELCLTNTDLAAMGLSQQARHRTGLLNWYDYAISTGPLEGTNTKIRVLQRQAYGFHDPEFFKLKIYALHKATYALVG